MCQEVLNFFQSIFIICSAKKNKFPSDLKFIHMIWCYEVIPHVLGLLTSDTQAPQSKGPHTHVAAAPERDRMRQNQTRWRISHSPTLQTCERLRTSRDGEATCCYNTGKRRNTNGKFFFLRVL